MYLEKHFAWNLKINITTDIYLRIICHQNNYVKNNYEQYTTEMFDILSIQFESYVLFL